MVDDQVIILGLEQGLLTPSIRKSVPCLDKILANEFIEIGQSGTIYDKKSIINTLGTKPDKTIIFEDMKVRLLSNSLALVTYKTKTRGRPFVRRYSLWERAHNHWQLVFHEARK